MIHLAILKPGYIRDILAGTKTVESRLTKTMQPPHGKVTAGERLFLKASGGPFMATAVAGRVETFADLTPAEVKRLRKDFGKLIGGDDAYWEMKRNSKYATLIWLDRVEPIDVGPAYKVAYMKAWYVLNEAVSPLRQWTLTDGAIRNRYASLPGASEKLKDAAITLELPDGQTVVTKLVKGRQLQWRGWGPMYDAAGAEPGDAVRFVATGPRRYRVSVVKENPQ